MRRVLKLLLVLASGSAASFSAAQSNGLGGIAVSPLMFREQTNSGARFKISVDINNLQPSPSTATLTLHPVTFEDWSYVPKFDVANPKDASGWFKQRQQTIEVPGGTTKQIVMECVVPHVKTGVYWCMGTVDPRYQGDTSTIHAQYQIPIILLVGPQPKPSLKLGSPKLIGTPNECQVAIPFENDGDGFTVIGDVVQVQITKNSATVSSGTDNDRNLYPGTKRNLVFNVGALSPGEYTIISRPQAGSRSFGKMISRFVVTRTDIQEASASALLAMAPVIMEPPSIKMAMPPGGQRSTVVRVTNVSNKDVHVTVEPRSVGQNMTGAIELGEATPKSPLTLTVEPAALDLAPGATGAVRLTVAGDKSAAGDEWFGVAASTQGPNEIAEELYGSVTFPGGAPKLEVKQVDLQKTNGYPMTLVYQVANTGSVALRPLAFADVLEEGLAPVASLQVPRQGDGGILPGTVLENQVALPLNLKPGTYSISVKYQYGTDAFATLSVPMTVPAIKAPAAKPKKRGRGG